MSSYEDTWTWSFQARSINVESSEEGKSWTQKAIKILLQIEWKKTIHIECGKTMKKV